MQQQQQQPQPTADLYQTVGVLSAIDNKRAYRPLRVSITEESGQVRWYSAFEGIGRSLEAGGQGSGPWTITYVERPYTTAAGATGINLNVRQAILGGQAPQPQAQPQALPQAQPQALAVAAQYFPDAPPAWTLNMDDRGHAIIRQVAFKAAADLAGLARLATEKVGDDLPSPWSAVKRIADMTDVFEQIILGTYVPPVPPDDGAVPEPTPTAPPADDEFTAIAF